MDNPKIEPMCTCKKYNFIVSNIKNDSPKVK